MGTISKAAFNQDIAELVEKTADLDLRYQWQFNDYRNEQFLSNSSVLELNGETILRTFHITYSESYGVPILWFIFSRQTGALLSIEEILELMPADKQKAISADCLTSISQREHPAFNLLFYHFHPCRTADVMKNVRYDNYVISWLSIFGSLLHLLPLPNEIFMKK
ncbi:autophagocytosis associated protein domain-containing protein [Loa loa]|uniref:Ubiquitin-like-conjugating enzyme ATG10 n=1 Tax=Loa loa TaxID=7209 RepID=A0A1I7VWZ6_LOALO|nr:autophagocytosis associated protein domain-containing protein [Loa loa]EFO17560.2 autophagocytosis associated protein domain-containing protein [Loa loa]